MIKIQHNIEKITVVSGSGTDTVFVQYAALPSAVYPFDGPLTMKFEAACGRGVEYVREHFGVDPQLITC